MAIVGTLEHPLTHERLPVHFTMRTGMFHCAVGTALYEAETLKDLKANVFQDIERASALVWMPVIALRYSHFCPPAGSDGETASHLGTSLGLTRERKYVTALSLDTYREVPWDTDPEARFVMSTPFLWEGEAFTLPITQKTSTDGVVIYLPYTQATWEALKEIQQYLFIVGSRLAKHITSPEGIGAILEAGRSLFDHLATRVDIGSDTE